VCLYTASKEAKDVIINSSRNSSSSNSSSSSSSSKGCAAAVRTNLSTTATGVMNTPASAGSESPSSISSSSSLSSSQLNSKSNEKSNYNTFSSSNCDTKKAWALCLHRFYSDIPDGKGNYEYRNNSIKLFPHIVQANWAVQMAIG